MSTEKTALRKVIRELKAKMGEKERDQMSESICRKVLSHPQWKAAHTILLYYALPDETNTGSLIETALKEGKKVLLPVVEGNDLQLKCFTGETRLGKFNIEEPTGPEFYSYACIDLVIVPGIAFDQGGNRLGRGKGYYDRTLPLLSNAYKIGLCFPFQILESIPHEEHDIKMDYVVC